MLNHLRPTPVFCSAIGTAAGFYLLSSLDPVITIILLFISLVVLCFFRVLSSLYRIDFLCGEESKHSRILQLTAVCSVAFAAGLMLGVCAANSGRRILHLSLPQDRITAIEGVLLEDPAIISGGRAAAVLSLKSSFASDSTVVINNALGVRASSRGEITVFFPQENAVTLREFGRGAQVFAEGSLRPSQGSLIFAASSMHVVKPAPAIERMRTSLRLNLISRFDSKDWGGLALALLLGIKDNLDNDLAAMYRKAGCSYILALSGMHLAVLAALIAFLLKKPLGLKGASIAGAVIILLYCFLVGPMPSLNRAALMYLLGVVAILGAFPREPLSILSLSFLVQIIITPAAGNSISFILSYLALAGILIIGQPLYSLFAGIVPDFLMQPLSASCGAFLATAGITSFSFNFIAPAGIIVGLILVPLTTVFMIGSLIYLVLDFFSIAGFLSLPLSLLYRLMESIVSFAGRAGGITAGRPLVILVISLVLSLLIVILENRQREARLKLKPFP